GCSGWGCGRNPAGASSATMAAASAGVEGRIERLIGRHRRSSCERRVRSWRSARHEEFDERADAPVTHLDEIDELGRDQRAGDLGVYVDAPVSRGSCALDGERAQFVAAQPEGLDQDAKPGADLADAGGGDRDRLAVARACDAQPRIGGEAWAHPPETALATGGVQALQELVHLDAPAS